MNDKLFWRSVHAGISKMIEGLDEIRQAIVKHKTSARDSDRKQEAV